MQEDRTILQVTRLVEREAVRHLTLYLVSCLPNVMTASPPANAIKQQLNVQRVGLREFLQDTSLFAVLWRHFL